MPSAWSTVATPGPSRVRIPIASVRHRSWPGGWAPRRFAQGRGRRRKVPLQGLDRARRVARLSDFDVARPTGGLAIADCQGGRPWARSLVRERSWGIPGSSRPCQSACTAQCRSIGATARHHQRAREPKSIQTHPRKVSRKSLSGQPPPTPIRGDRHNMWARSCETRCNLLVEFDKWPRNCMPIHGWRPWSRKEFRI